MKKNNNYTRRHFMEAGIVSASTGLLASSLSHGEEQKGTAEAMSTSEKVRYSDLLPSEFRARLVACPVAYLPLGTIEWHGEHLPLGSDAIQSEALMVECAKRFGGIVWPPIHLGPDRAQLQEDGSVLIGMDYATTTKPPHQLDGSCYWVSQGIHLQQVDAILAQMKRAGFKAVFADGHGPSRWSWVENIQEREIRYGMKLLGVTKEVSKEWRSQIDHAARNETSLMLHFRPDLVDMSRLPESRDELLQGVGGSDPRDATAEHGKECAEISIEMVGRLLEDTGLLIYK